MTKPTLTKAEAEALLAAAGNIDPCMFDEMNKGGAAMRRAWERGQVKLRDMIDGVQYHTWPQNFVPPTLAAPPSTPPPMPRK